MNEINGLIDGHEYHKNVSEKITQTVPWTAKGLKITRLRLLSDVGFPFWDISYCHGILNGQPVEVQLPFDQIPKRNKFAFIVKQAIKDNVYAKGLGILNPLIISTLQ
jgi:hypothetical protein